MNGRRTHLDLFLIAVALIFASDFVAGAHPPQLPIYNTPNPVNQSNPTNLTGMTIGAPNVTGRVDPSTSNGHVYRPPQVPLDVGLYPKTPEGLKLEQVHVFVRHGMSIVPLHNNLIVYTAYLQVNVPPSAFDSRVLPPPFHSIG